MKAKEGHMMWPYEYMSKEEMAHKLEEMKKSEEDCTKQLKCRQDKEAKN